jgi:hypothetical protein
MGTLTKAELIVKGKKLGLDLKASMLKGEMEKAIAKAERKPASKAKASTHQRKGEY